MGVNYTDVFYLINSLPFGLRQDSIDMAHVIVKVDLEKLQGVGDVQRSAIRVLKDRIVFFFRLYFSQQARQLFANFIPLDE